MKSYDAKCPRCGTINHNLYLEETHGWMECEHCQQTMQVMKFTENNKIPVFAPKKLAACFVATN